MSPKYKVVIFSGGRGASTIIEVLSRIDAIELKILLNAYDDGKSTGRLRKMIPEMLGPSDIRKNISNILKVSKREDLKLLADLLEYRIGDRDSTGRSWNISDNVNFSDLSKLWLGEEYLSFYMDRLTKKLGDKLTDWLIKSLDFLAGAELGVRPGELVRDIPVGNLFFVGAYLQSGANFNSTIENISGLLELGPGLLNISNGENRVVVALKEDGSLLLDESAIVSGHESPGRIKRIYLLSSYLDENQLDFLKLKSIDERDSYLRSLEKLPLANQVALSSLREADMIIYGPGTQHSSLFPSYMTLGVSDAIAENTTAQKVMIANLGFDFDILEENTTSLAEKLVYYLNVGRENLSMYDGANFITNVFTSFNSELERASDTRIDSYPTNDKFTFAKWEHDSNRHDGEKVVRALLTLASMKADKFLAYSYTSLTIIVPVLDEIPTLPKVMRELIEFDWLEQGYAIEIVVVDGGSRDGSWEYLESLQGIRLLRCETVFGRGAAIRKGLENSNGEVTITYPADNEYEISAILDVAKVLINRDARIVFGTRTTLCIDTDERLREIYEGRTREYFYSKWGGFVLSLCSAVLHRRWISDPLTSIKGFRLPKYLPLSFLGNSLDWDTRIITESRKHFLPIAEIPVSYFPRSIDEGKKTNLKSGIGALLELLKRRGGVFGG